MQGKPVPVVVLPTIAPVVLPTISPSNLETLSKPWAGLGKGGMEEEGAGVATVTKVPLVQWYSHSSSHITGGYKHGDKVTSSMIVRLRNFEHLQITLPPSAKLESD
jgi:hypothetical protein